MKSFATVLDLFLARRASRVDFVDFLPAENLGQELGACSEAAAFVLSHRLPFS